MPKLIFKTSNELASRIEAYFDDIKGGYHLLENPVKETKGFKKDQRVCEREAVPATIAGLALFLGFNSKQAFDSYQQHGKFANVIKTAVLRVETEYEKKLHQQSAGVIFALKSLGWDEKPDNGKQRKEVCLKVKIFETGPKTTDNEKEVIL